MKKNTLIIVLLLAALALSGCSKAEDSPSSEKTRAVKIEKISNSSNSVSLSYVGTVDSKNITNYSFKSPGKLSRLHVKEGDRVSAGDILAQIDTQDISPQLDASSASLSAARENIKKAKDQLDYNEQQVSKMEALYKSGAISSDQLDQTRLQRDISKSSYAQANSQYESAFADYSSKQTLMDDSAIYARENGIVADISFEEGERVGASDTVISLRSSDQIVNIGIAQGDLKNVKVGDLATVDVDGSKAHGRVESIDEVPDISTRTYKAEIRVDGSQYRLGMIAKVSIDIGKKQGVWIPIESVFSDGESYVYVVDKNRAFKKTVEIVENHENKMMVKGLAPGEFLAVSGMKNLNDGSKIKIVGQGE